MVYARYKRPDEKNAGNAAFADSGFTLIEVMVILIIVGILSTIAFSSLATLLPRTRTNAAVRQLRNDLQKAKLEAIKRNTDCLVEFTLSATGSDGTCLSCIDNNSDNACDETNDTMITQLDLNDYDGAELSSASFSGNLIFVFNSRGMPEQTSGAMCSGTAVVNCTSDATYSRSIVMSSVGRLRID